MLAMDAIIQEVYPLLIAVLLKLFHSDYSVIMGPLLECLLVIVIYLKKYIVNCSYYAFAKNRVIYNV